MDSSQSSQSGHPQMDYEFNTPELGQAYYDTEKRQDILSMGAGKPMPPALPDTTEYVVEFDEPDDPAHPLNWSFTVKYAILWIFPLIMALLIVVNPGSIFHY